MSTLLWIGGRQTRTIAARTVDPTRAARSLLVPVLCVLSAGSLAAGCARHHLRAATDSEPADASIPSDSPSARDAGSDGGAGADAGSLSVDAGDSLSVDAGDSLSVDPGSPCIDRLGPDETVADPAIALGAGTLHSCLVTEAGAVHCWGRNDDGQATGEAVPAAAPLTRVLGIPPMVRVTAAFTHSCAVSRSGALYCWGRRPSEGGAESTSTAPRQVILPGQVDDVCSGTDHTCAVLVSGSVYCWGASEGGALGLGGISRAAPTRVDAPPATAIACGARSTCIVARGGEIWCWGESFHAATLYSDGRVVDARRFDTVPTRQLAAPGSATDVTVGNVRCSFDETGAEPLRCWGQTLAVLGRGGRRERWDGREYDPRPMPVVGLERVRAASVDAHACAVTLGGEAACWGYNVASRLGTPGVELTAPQRVPGICDAVDVATGVFHTCVLSAAGVVTCWGRNDELSSRPSAPSLEVPPSRVWPAP